VGASGGALKEKPFPDGGEGSAEKPGGPNMFLKFEGSSGNKSKTFNKLLTEKSKFFFLFFRVTS
jgi:hypothetical protein